MKEYILIYCIEGQGFVEIGNEKHNVHKGNLFFYDINSPHAYGAVNTNPWSIHWGHFIGQGVLELFSIIGISKAAPLIYVGDQPKILNLLAKIREKISSGYTLINLLYASNCFLQMICYLTELKMSLKLNYTIDFNMEDMITFMLANLYTTLTLDEFTLEYGYQLRVEDFINKGDFNVSHMPANDRKRDLMELLSRFFQVTKQD